MVVQKTVHRSGRTLEHGSFVVRETVYVCKSGCRWPSGLRVIQRSSALAERIRPHSGVGYDVMTFIGIERFIHFRQRDEICAELHERHRLTISSGEVSRLSKLFLFYLERLHHARSSLLRDALETDGGWPLHIDATGEDGRGTLFVALAGWRNWVLGSFKIPTEHADAILPHLRTIVANFGAPCAIVRDLGRAMKRAAKDLVKEYRLDIPILACHLHFLADVGKDLLSFSHKRLRNLFRQLKVRPRLRALARELGRALGGDIKQARIKLAAWQQDEEQAMVIPEGQAGLATVRALAQWVLDYHADGFDKGFPFDRPYLDLYRRCIRAGRAIRAFLLTPPQEKKVRKALGKLRTILETVSENLFFGKTVRILERRTGLFEELRTALRLTPKPSRRNETLPIHPVQKSEALVELNDIRKSVDVLSASLRSRRPQRGPAHDRRTAIDIILHHLDVHGENLWGHAIPVRGEKKENIRLVERTNNILEGLFHLIKRGERRRSGRKNLANDLETMPASVVLARNLESPDYVTRLCGTLEGLPQAFAGLDAEERQQKLQQTDLTLRKPAEAEISTASASLPREDRAIVRSEAMQRKICLAAGFRKSKPPHFASLSTPKNLHPTEN